MARRKEQRPVVERTADGYVINLETEERELVARLMAELRALLLADDPTNALLLQRLFPPAYLQPDDAESEAEYQRFMREELVASRLASLNTVETALTEGTALDDEAMNGFLHSLNAVRLVLGTLLEVSEVHDPTDVRDDDPMVGEHHLYSFLSWLLEWSVRALGPD
ncbi:MAG TPA: DUF2017 family protein [Ilumatobacteraceae bacterium]|nr:DUF2017 family protein [Ilumatobacteraceae bacterium]